MKGTSLGCIHGISRAESLGCVKKQEERGKRGEEGAALEQLWTQLAPQGSNVKDPLSSGNMLNPRGETEADNHCVAK